MELNKIEPLKNQRPLFPIPEHITYFNCAYMSPQAQPIHTAGEKALDRKSSPWEIHPDHFFEEASIVRRQYAELINAESTEIALISSVSYGIGVAATNLNVPADSNILVLEDQFPSNYYPWHARAEECKAKLLVVPRPVDGDWTRTILDHLDHQVAVAALPNCHWTDGGFVDLEIIGPRCRELGIPLVVDGTQSVGTFPFDVSRVRPAFLVTAFYKWLLGPYSVAMMYVDPEYHQGQPLEYNWINRVGSNNFARLVDYSDELMPDASRYDIGERSNFALLPMCLAALKLISGWGVPRIAATLGGYNRELAKGAASLGFHTAPDNLRIPHLLGLRFQDQLPDGLAVALRKRHIYVSIRGDAIRVSPYLYNTEVEREHFLKVLASLL